MSNNNDNNNDITLDFSDPNTDALFSEQPSIQSEGDSIQEVESPDILNSEADSLFDTESMTETMNEAIEESSADDLFNASEPVAQTNTGVEEANELFSTPSPTPSDADDLFSSPSPTPSDSDDLFSSPSPTPSDADDLFSSPSPTPSDADDLFSSPSPTPSDSDALFNTPSLDSPTSSLDEIQTNDNITNVPDLEPIPTSNEIPNSNIPSPNNMSELNGLDGLDDLNLSASTGAWAKPSAEDTTTQENLEEESVNTEDPNNKKKGKKAKKEKKIKEPKDTSNKPRKKWPIVLASVLGALLILGLLGVYLVVINPTTSNQILSTVLKPKQYYGKIELANIEKIKENNTKNFDSNFAAMKNISSSSSSSSSTIQLEEGAYEYAAYLGNYASIFKSLKNITLKTDSYVDNDKLSTVIDVILNDTTITTINVMMDKKTSTVYAQVPLISKRWFSFTPTKEELSSLENMPNLQADVTITAKDINSMIDTYLPVVIYVANDITLNKNVTLVTNNSKLNVKDATIKFSSEDMGKLMGGILNQAKTDKVLYRLLEQIGLFKSQDEFTKTIDKLIENAKQSGTDKFTPIDMHVYIDKVGNIVGRKFEIKDTNNPSSLEYMTDVTGNISKSSLFYEDKKTDLSILNDNTVNGTKNSGKVTFSCEYKSSNETEDENDLVATPSSGKLGFTITYNDFSIDDKNKGLMSGTATLKLSDMPIQADVGATITLTNDRKYQSSELTVSLADKKLVTLKNVNSESSKKDVVLPSVALPGEIIMADKVSQYNLLLEVNFAPTISAISKSMNNKLFTSMLAMYARNSGLLYLNGKQTPATLLALSKDNPKIKEIFLAGYKATKLGTNTGLDALANKATQEGSQESVEKNTDEGITNSSEGSGIKN